MECPCEFGIEPPGSISHGVSILKSTVCLVPNMTLKIKATFLSIAVFFKETTVCLVANMILKIKVTLLLLAVFFERDYGVSRSYHDFEHKGYVFLSTALFFERDYCVPCS